MFENWVHESPYVFVLTAAACVGAVLVILAWRRRDRPAGLHLALMMSAGFLWVLFYTFELSSSSLGMKLLWSRLEYLGIVPVSLLWFLFARAYTSSKSALSRARLVLLAAVPVITLGLVATNGLHGLMWRSASIKILHSVPLLVFQQGPWFWVHVGYSYALVAAGTYLLMRAVYRYPLLYRGQARLLMLAIAVSWAGNAVALFVLRDRGIDPTPFVFVVAGLMLTLAYSRHRLYSLLPTLLLSARDHMLEKMKDGVVVLDADGRVVSMNAAASELLAAHGVSLGRPAAGVLSEVTAAIMACGDDDELHSELILEHEGDPCRYLDVVSTRLRGRGAGMGWLLVLRDVTESRAAEQAIRASEGRFRAIIEQFAEGFFLTDENARIIEWNSAMEVISGLGQAEVLGRPSWEVHCSLAARQDSSPDRLEHAKALLLEALSTGDAPFFGRAIEAEIRRPDGERRHVQETAFPVRTGEAMGIGHVVRDVTAHKKAEEALSQSEARYRDLVESSHDWVWELDEQGRYSFASSKIEQVLGYEPAEVLGKSPLDLMPAEESLRVDALLGELVDHRRPFRDFENVTRHKGGHLVTLETSGAPIFDESGVFRGYHGTGRDITARKEMEQVLRLTQLSVDRASDSIFWVDAEGRFTYANDASCRRLGYEREELLAMSVHDVDPHAARPWGPHFQRVKECGSLRFESVQRTKDGRLLPVEIVANYVCGDGREYLFAYARDIAEQKRNEEALRESEGRFRAVFDNTATGIAMIDSNGRAFRSNPALARMLGYSVAELGRVSLLDITCEEDLGREDLLLHELLQGTRDHYQLEKRFLRKGGEPLWVQMTGSLVRDDSGEPLCGVTVVVDIAERKEAERALEESEEQLRQAQKMEAVGQLAGGIAHDFNNLLMVIIGNASLALVGAGPDDPKRRFLSDIKEAGERAAGLTRQILAFSRRQILQPRVVQLNEVVTGMDPLLRRTLGEHIDLVMLLSPDLETTEVDPHQIEQVLMNLAINARDAMPKTGLLTIETANVDLDRAHCLANPQMKPGPHVMLAVSDTGCGMSAETQARMFEPFFTTKDVGKGTGLGLSTVFGIVKQSGGCILVESEPGQGSTFKVFLPVAHSTADSHERRTPAREVKGGDETILVVEDEPGARDLLVRILSSWGYKVLEAANARDVDVVLDAQPAFPDLALTDVVLPGGRSGRDVADALVAREPDLPVIFMSGYTRDSVVHNGRLDDGLEFLQKPFAPDVLLAKVRMLLDRAQRVRGGKTPSATRGQAD